MSKVQVDTIVDKDDISAPSLTKGAIVTGVCTATSFDGAISEWVLGANGSSDYTFTGSGLTGAENDPTLYLKRGQKYRFKNSSGGHPFRIQSTANGSTGTAYNDGVTNNDAGDGTTLEWDVQFDAPDVLYYQCTSHGGMGGKIYIGNSGNSSTLVDLNVSGVTTTGIATVTTSVVVGSAVTANADGVITAGVGTFGSVVSGAISGSTGTFTGDIDIAENIIHTGDTDTKIHFSSADQISFDTGGTTRVNITSGGNLEMPNDSDYIKIGASGDLQLVHTGGVSYISDSGSPLEIRTDTLKIASGVGTEAFRVGGDGQLGVAGANYGTSGQVLTSGGSAASPSWATPSSGLSEYDQWQCTDHTETNSEVWDFDIIGSSNPNGGPVTLARTTTSQNPRFAKIGTGMSFSAGIWTFPSTGYWEVIMSAQLYTTQNATRNFRLETTENNSTYTTTATMQGYGGLYWSTTHNWISYFNITDVSNQKIRYLFNSSGTNCSWYGANDQTRTNWIFKKVG